MTIIDHPGFRQALSDSGATAIAAARIISAVEAAQALEGSSAGSPRFETAGYQAPTRALQGRGKDPSSSGHSLHCQCASCGFPRTLPEPSESSSFQASQLTAGEIMTAAGERVEVAS